MKSSLTSLDQRLIAAGQGRAANDAFVRATLQNVRRASATATFEQALHTTESTRSSWLQRLQRLPKMAAAGIGLGTVILTAGTAYAAYSLWLSPTAQIRSVVQQYGRDQALIELKNCDQPNQKTDVEITKGSGGTASGAAKALAAQCELQAIQNWTIKRFHEQPSQVMFALTVTQINNHSLSVKDPQTSQTYVYSFSKNTPFAFQGSIIGQQTLKAGDTVALVMGGGTPNAIVKLSFAPSYYLGGAVPNTYHERHDCIGNTDASCIDLPMLDVLRSGEGGVNGDAPGAIHQIQGKLIALSPTEFSLQTTSGKIYTVHTNSDVIGSFNTANPYGSMSIESGDVLEVMYSVPAGGNAQDIQSTQYHEIELLLQGFDKKASSTTNQQKYHF